MSPEELDLLQAVERERNPSINELLREHSEMCEEKKRARRQEEEHHGIYVRNSWLYGRNSA
jgi:hypothetical protein